jgi:hypothetical protein
VGSSFGIYTLKKNKEEVMLVHYVRKSGGEALVKRELLQDASCLIYAMSQAEEVSDIDDVRDDLLSISKELRNLGEEKVGALVGFKDEDGVVLIGYSKFDKDYDLPFVKRTAREYAINRALVYKTRYNNVKRPVLPNCIEKELPLFLVRCRNYFKTSEFSTWVLGWIEHVGLSFILKREEEENV